MSATHPISGAATAAKATSAPSAHSSLADFLLAGAPGNAGDDFRTIAATLFGVANSAPAKTQAPAKDPAAKEPGDIRKESQGKAKDDKDSSGQASALAAHPELSVALLNTAHASIQNLPQPVTLEPSKKAGSVSMPSSNGDDIAAKLAGNVPPNEGLALSRAWTNSLLPAVKQADIEALGAVDGEGAKEMPSGPGEGRTPVLQPLLDQPLGKQPLASDRVQQAKEGAPAIPSWFGSGMPGKKSAEPAKPGNTRLQEPGVDGAATRNSTQAPNIAKPILPADASVMASVNEVHPAATDYTSGSRTRADYSRNSAANHRSGSDSCSASLGGSRQPGCGIQSCVQPSFSRASYPKSQIVVIRPEATRFEATKIVTARTLHLLQA